MRWYRAHAGAVCEIIDFDPAGIYSTELIWTGTDDQSLALGLPVDEAGDFVPPADIRLARRRATMIEAVKAKAAAIEAAGAPVTAGGPTYHIELTDGARANMGSMATTAIGAVASLVPWPAEYQRGWITIENPRIPLPTPADGLALASAVGIFYAANRQRGRDLKDAILAAADDAALDAIDIETGWPS